jgi:hypothetical protein
MVSAMLGDSLTMIAATFTTELSNIDSRTSTGAQHRFKTPFDNCAFAGQRTVLQHIPPRRTESSRGVLPPFVAEPQSQDREDPKLSRIALLVSMVDLGVFT